jgi:RND family efflux transporter MFP subunit
MAWTKSRQSPLSLRPGILAVWLLFLGLCAGCGRRNVYVPPPLPDVQVSTPVQQPVTIYAYFTGNTQASETVEIRSRVQGYLESIHFTDGTNVKRGDLLFVIDRRPYQAQVDQAKATLASKKAVARRAEALYNRTLALLPSGAASQEEADQRKGDWEVAKADIAQAKASLRTAELNLEFTEIRAPIGGRISRRQVDIGNLVLADTTLLTTVDRYNPMYAYFTVSESDFLDYLKRQRQQSSRPPEEIELPPVASATAVVAALPVAPSEAWRLAPLAARLATPRYPVEMGLANDKGYPHRGIIDFSDNTVDPSTGTLQVRGTFPNSPPYILVPGLFARLRVPAGKQDRALLVPERALGTDQAGRYLLVLNKDNVVGHRPVQVGAKVEGLRVIDSGLKPGERFIVEGLQRARPGNKVHPIPAPSKVTK